MARTRKTVTISMNEEIFYILKDKNIKVSTLINQLLQEWLKKEEKK